MATKISLCLLALFAAVSCHPVGQTTVCETAPKLQNFHGAGLKPGYGVGGTTVCESTPNHNYPYGFGFNGLGHLGATTTVCENSPSLGALGGHGYAGVIGETTVCSSTPSLPTPSLGVLGCYNNLGYLGYPYGFGYGLNGFGFAPTVCESVPNIGLEIGSRLPPCGTVCENSPNFAYGYGGYGHLPGLSYGETGPVRQHLL